MSKDGSDDLAKELAKQLPIKELYADAASPAAKQTGQLLEDIIKTLRLALAPFQFGGAYQDRLRTFIDRAVRRVPEAQRVSPAPQILGPVVEGIRYEPENTPIDEMFSQLLSTSMDRGTVDKAHPSYPFIIKQLSADEAKVLMELRAKTFPFGQLHRLEGGVSYAGAIEVDAFPRESLTFPRNLHFYMDHLHQLGLAGIMQVPPQEPMYEDGRQIGVRVRSAYRLTDTGHRFLTACAKSEAKSG
jgi:hypothetical protein